MKYTIQQIKEGKYFCFLNEEQFNKLLPLLSYDSYEYPAGQYGNDLRFDLTDLTYGNEAYFVRTGRYTEIKFEDIDFGIPKKWCIKITGANRLEVADYLLKNKHRYPNYRPSWAVIVDKYYYSEEYAQGG